MTCNPSRDTVKSVLLASFHEKSKSSHSRRSFSRQLFFVSHSLFFRYLLSLLVSHFVNVSRELIHMSGNVSSSHDTHVFSRGYRSYRYRQINLKNIKKRRESTKTTHVRRKIDKYFFFRFRRSSAIIHCMLN